MKKIILTLLILTNIYGYEKGDVIPATLASYIGITKDKIYIIDFFASWCSSCKKEVPLLSKLNEQLDKIKFEIIGIDVDKKISKGLKFQKDLKENGNLSFKVVNDPQNSVIRAFSPIGMPTLYYVKNRKILAIITGAIDNIDKVILKDLEELE